MTEPDLLTISVFAFSAVFLLLALLAALMRLLTALFPHRAEAPDDAVVAGITAAAAAAYPGTRVTRIEERQ